MKERNRQAQARRRARLSTEEAALVRARDREAQTRRRAQRSSQEATEARARNREEQARRRARLPESVAAGFQSANTLRHREIYWADWPVEYRNYARHIAAAQRLFYAQARPAEGPPLRSPLCIFSLALMIMV